MHSWKGVDSQNVEVKSESGGAELAEGSQSLEPGAKQTSEGQNSLLKRIESNEWLTGQGQSLQRGELINYIFQDVEKNLQNIPLLEKNSPSINLLEFVYIFIRTKHAFFLLLFSLINCFQLSFLGLLTTISYNIAYYCVNNLYENFNTRARMMHAIQGPVVKYLSKKACCCIV